MKKLYVLLVLGFVVLGLNIPTAQAVPEFKKKFDAKYVEASADEKFKTAAEEAKCNVCHYGKSKKNRNDYGLALSELLKKDDYKADRIKAQPEQVEKEIYEAFEKIEAVKSTNGQSYGERIKSGELPGINPPDED
jgi:predicted ATP-dependent protease